MVKISLSKCPALIAANAFSWLRSAYFSMSSRDRSLLGDHLGAAELRNLLIP
jgi:hypothetical protein